ncbi:MAG: ATPase [Eubacteriales bacterium]|nr:ATPase [Eubacteriales bacterium]
MSSRIEQIIEEIEEYVDSCKFQPLSSTKIVVNKEELEELLRELRMKTPDEIKRYQKIISNKDAILADAQTKADAILADAQDKQAQMVQENEVMQAAMEQSEQLLEQTRRQAQEMLDSATADANNIRMSAISYTDDMLANLEQIMNHATETVGAKYNTFINAIQSCNDIVTKNRMELSPQVGNNSNYVPTGDTSAEDEFEEE